MSADNNFSPRNDTLNIPRESNSAMSTKPSAIAQLTLDSDFRVYRRNKRQSLPLICP